MLTGARQLGYSRVLARVEHTLSVHVGSHGCWPEPATRGALMSLLRTGPNWHATTAHVLSIVPIIHGNHPGRMVRNRLRFVVAGIPIRIREKVARHYGRQVVQFSLSLPHP